MATGRKDCGVTHSSCQRACLAPFVVLNVILLWCALPNAWWTSEGDECANDLVLVVDYHGFHAAQGCEQPVEGNSAKGNLPIKVAGSSVAWSQACNWLNTTAEQEGVCSTVKTAHDFHLAGTSLACVPLAAYLFAAAIMLCRTAPGSCVESTYNTARILTELVVCFVSAGCVVVMGQLDTAQFPFQRPASQELSLGISFWLTMVAMILSGLGLAIEAFIYVWLRRKASKAASCNFTGNVV